MHCLRKPHGKHSTDFFVAMHVYQVLYSIYKGMEVFSFSTHVFSDYDAFLENDRESWVYTCIKSNSKILL